MRRTYRSAARQEFGYPAEGGAEFVHGAAPVTRALMREAGLSLQPRSGTRWSTRTGALSPDEFPASSCRSILPGLEAVTADLPIAEFLETHFAERQYDELRRAVTRTVEGYDAADPRRSSTLALRDEWMGRDDGEHGRIAQGYGALVEFLAAECRRRGADDPAWRRRSRDRGHARRDCRTLSRTAPSSRPMPRSSPCRSRSCPKSRFRRRRASGQQPLPISGSAMSSRFCCASRRDGGPIVADATSPTCRS